MIKKRCKTRISCLGAFLLLVICLPSCADKAARTGADAQSSAYLQQPELLLPDSVQNTSQNTSPAAVPELGRIKRICELATVECTYHNVAKSKKYPGTGIEHLGETERTFWIEYTGIAELSFPVDEIQMEMDGTEITITLPKPKVTCKVDPDSWTEDSYVISEDQIIQKNPITAADQTRAIEVAQANMILKIRGNSTLLTTAQMQAQELIQNYINQIGELTGMEYHITWKDTESGV